MMIQGEENDGINIVLLGGAIVAVLLIGAIIYGAYRLYRRLIARYGERQP